MTIRAVFFDVDDTLVDYDRAARAAFHEALGNADFDLWLAMSDPHFARYGRGEVGFEQMRLERMAHFLQLSGRSPDDAAALEQRRFEQLWTSYELFEDVSPCLAALRARDLRLGLITNNEPVHQQHKLALVGLADGFDAVVISGAVGVAKPDAAIFTLACDLLDVTPGQALHVGDRLDLDAVAATDAGLRGVWLDRQGRDRSAVPDGVAVVDGLDELADLVA